jgi:hypothetical protein
MIMNDLSAYHIKHTAAERAHIHMWGSTVHVFPLLLGGDGGGGLDGHLIFCLLYIPLRDTFASGFFLPGVFLVANTNILVFFLGRVIITYVFSGN